jgi:hypothetical protein
MEANTRTSGKVNIVTGEGRTIPAKNVEVQVFEQDYLGPLFNLPLMPTLLCTVPTDDQGHYEAHYNSLQYTPARILDEEWVDYGHGDTRPGKPDLFVVVRIGSASYRFPPHGVRRDVTREHIKINCDITENTPLYGGSIHDLFRFIEKHQDELSALGGNFEEICDTAGDRVEDILEEFADQLDTAFDNRVGDGLRTIGRGTNLALDFIGRQVRIRWEDLVTHLLDRDDLEHVIHDYQTSRNVESVPQTQAATFNSCKIATPDGFDDSGVRTRYRLTDAGQVQFLLPYNDDWQPLVWRPDHHNESMMISYTKQRGRGKADKLNGGFDTAPAPAFDMLAVDGNRVFVKEKGRDNFYFTTLFEEFPKGCRQNGRIVDVPGCYLKLDPEDFKPGSDDADLGWWSSDDWDHPGMRGYGFMPYAKFGVKHIVREHLDLHLPANAWGMFFLRHFRVFPDIMMVKVEPRLFHLIDARPPYGSGTVMPGLPAYDHVTYKAVGFAGLRPEVLLPGIFRTFIGMEETFQSIEFQTVQSIGVANAHRHIHYEDIYGGEISNGLDHVLVGPIYDRGGSCDGTCNFYILCRLKSDINQEYAYGILWMDEQSYFSERWRLLSPFDNKWGRLREWAMSGALKYLFTLETLRSIRDGLIEAHYWCPFKAKCIDHGSRMAVSRYTVAVAGHDPKLERDEIYTIAFQWGAIDRTWRWRLLPKAKVTRGLELPMGRRTRVLPETIAIRPDMTIHMKGTRQFGRTTIQGRWYQRYLPADNWEVPLAAHLTDNQKPVQGYQHPWKFMSEACFKIADRYSHFGNYATPLSSRSQYYPIWDLPTDFASDESVEWREYELSTKVLALDKLLDDPAGWIANPKDWPGILTQRTPSEFNLKYNRLRIVRRGSRGWVAMHWDKRDDDLYPFDIPATGKRISLVNPITDQVMSARIGRQKRKWSPPVVQAVLVKSLPEEQKFQIRFSSMVPRKPRSLQEPIFADIPALRDLSNYLNTIFNGADNDPYIYHAQQQDWVRKEYPLPDATIWKVKLFVIDHDEDRGRCIKQWTIDDFAMEPYQFLDRPYQFRTTWHPDSDSDPPCEYAYDQLVQFFTARGRCEYGTSFIFEDITGHVAPPETTGQWFNRLSPEWQPRIPD